MKTYRTTMTVFGLSRGETFESDDPKWGDHVTAGLLERVGTSDEEESGNEDDEE